MLCLRVEWSEPEVEAFAAVIHQGDTVLDIGANIGAFTVPLAKLVGGSGRVIAFEPYRINYQMLNANIALNGHRNVWAHQVGVGSRQTTAKGQQLPFEQLSEQQVFNFGGMSIYPVDDVDRMQQMAAEQVQADDSELFQVHTIDSYNMQRVDFMKIDVQGNIAALRALQTAL